MNKNIYCSAYGKYQTPSALELYSLLKKKKKEKESEKIFEEITVNKTGGNKIATQEQEAQTVP